MRSFLSKYECQVFKGTSAVIKGKVADRYNKWGLQGHVLSCWVSKTRVVVDVD